MPARYHPLYDGVWHDDAFDATESTPAALFEERAFFVYLFGNHRQRPSGIYRVTDQQLSVDTGLSLMLVRRYLLSLATRRRIVRDGAWLFVRGYLARQPKHDNLLKAARGNIDECASEAILVAFAQRYPHLKGWIVDRLTSLRAPALTMDTASLHIQALTQPSINGRQTVWEGVNENRPQSSTEQLQSRAEQSSRPLASPSEPETARVQPTREELLDALAQSSGMSRDELKQQADQLAKKGKRR